VGLVCEIDSEYSCIKIYVFPFGKMGELFI
jgi:hypothetical protein